MFHGARPRPYPGHHSPPPPPQPAGPSPRWRSHGLALWLRTTERTCTPQAPRPLGWRVRTPGSESLGEGRKGVMRVVGNRAQHSPYPQLGGAQALASLKPRTPWEGKDKGSSHSAWCSLTQPSSVRTPGVLELPRSDPAGPGCLQWGRGRRWWGKNGNPLAALLCLYLGRIAKHLVLFLIFLTSLDCCPMDPFYPLPSRLPHTIVCVHGVWIHTSYRTSFFIPLTLTCLSG